MKNFIKFKIDNKTKINCYILKTNLLINLFIKLKVNFTSFKQNL
jgi:hypothetical protein